MKAAVFDIGGTFVKHGIYEDGVLKDVSSFPTCGQDGADTLIERIRNACGSITNIDAIGICTRGQVNCDTGEIIYDPPHLIPGYTGKNLKTEFSSFGVPIAVETMLTAWPLLNQTHLAPMSQRMCSALLTAHA